MNILIAFDKFKDCMNAEEACRAAEKGVRSTLKDADITLAPLTDGGEGFCKILTTCAQGICHHIDVQGALASQSEKQAVIWGQVKIDKIKDKAREILALPATSTKLGIIEMAQASGLERLSESSRNPWLTSTRGTGETIRMATAANMNALLLGIGGSATNDLGLGALEALGLKAFDINGNNVPCDTPASWAKVSRLDTSALLPIPPLRIACDVDNPLLGERGCTQVYGPQKGLLNDDSQRMEAELERMARLLCEACGKDFQLVEQQGMGAAGGIACGLHIAYDAQIVLGMPMVEAWLNIAAAIEQADVIFTGEGCFDSSSLSGKGPYAIIRAKQPQQKCIVFAGKITVDKDSLDSLRLDDAISIANPNISLEENLKHGEIFLTNAVSLYLASDTYKHPHMNKEAHEHQAQRHSRIKRLKKILRPLPRRTNIHRYPILKYFAASARKRSYLWTFRQRYVIRAIYIGTILSLLPLYGLQIALAFVLSVSLRANFMVMSALQFITNPVTFIPVYYACFKVGHIFLTPFTDAEARFNLEQIKEISTNNPLEMFTKIFENASGDIAHMFLSLFLGGLIIGYFAAFILSFIYQYMAYLMNQRHNFLSKKPENPSNAS